jgi:peptidoglycan/LPS O-acetylase OafA/YrhL
LRRQTGFNVPINGYRGLCALFVFVYHVVNARVITLTELGAPAEFVLSSFRYGVEMFFMISGFVIPISLARRSTIGRFLRDRFVRIFSAWLPILIVVSFVCSAFNMKMFTDLAPLDALGMFLVNVFLLPPLLPGTLIVAGSWSLTYEWVFYFAAAVLMLVLRRDRESRVARIAWAAAVGAFVIAFPRALFFLPGVLVFRYLGWFAQHKAWLRASGLSLIVFLLSWRFTGADKAELTETMLDWAYDGRLLAAVIALAAAVHLFASITLRATSEFAFLESRAFQFLGKISYSFYLWQSLVVSAVKRVVGAWITPHTGVAFGFVAVFVLALAVAVTLSWATWLLLEVRLAKRMRGWLSPAPEESQEEELPPRPAISFSG